MLRLLTVQMWPSWNSKSHELLSKSPRVSVLHPETGQLMETLKTGENVERLCFNYTVEMRVK